MDSPAATAVAAMLLDGATFSFPANAAGAGLGLGLTPRGGGTGYTPLPMQMTVSQTGMSAVAAALDQEEDRRRRTEVIVSMLAGKWGFVSREGVERASGRLGLECLWDDEVRKTTLTVAGTGVLVDVGFGARGEVVSVVVQFEGSGDEVRGGAGAVGVLLERDLMGEATERGYVRLEAFVGNLERLAGMDRLGSGGVSCFDAVYGVYRGLDRVFEWEVDKIAEQREDGAEEEVLCRQGGRPMMHARRRVGLALQYWIEKRLLSVKDRRGRRMDVDKPTSTEDQEEAASVIWSAIIECEASSADLYPSIRVSDAWVSEAVQKPPPADLTIIPLDDSPIDWQIPPPTFLSPQSPSNGNGLMDIDSNLDLQPKVPDVRFVAKFEPPVIVPLQLAIDIHQSVGAPLSQDMLLPTTYEGLVFSNTDGVNPPLSPRTIEKTATSYDPVTETSSSCKHRYSLLTNPQDYARAITHLPFSHPRQIVAILPTLRQWALTASILYRSFLPDSSSEDHTTSNGESFENGQDIQPTTFQSLEDELADFMSSPLPSDPALSSNGASGEKVKTVDMTLTTTPLPRLVFNFPNARYGGKLASVGFNVGLNGTIEGVAVDDGSPAWRTNGTAGIMDMDSEELKTKEVLQMREKVRKVLEIGEDIGVVVEWMSRE